MSDSVLNPALFQRLELHFGAGQVDVVSRGHAINWSIGYDHVPGLATPIPKRIVKDPGEEYRVRCRLCLDHRARLHINHRWGVRDDKTDSNNLWLINCFNENCFACSDARWQLFQSVWDIPLGQLRYAKGQTSRDVRRGVPADRPRDELFEMPNPGPLLSLEELNNRYPHHEALRYLRETRGFDPVFLSRYWGVSYCVMSPRHKFAADRIIIPIRQGGMQVGWQARYIGDNVYGESFSKAGVPKYYTSPGLAKHLVSYNIERALEHPTVVVVEGTTDVWNVGAMATALLGTSASEPVRKMIVDGMRRHGDQAVTVVLLDPQERCRVNPRKREHHITTLSAQLSAQMPGRVLPVWLPEQFDPGSMNRDLIYQLINAKARERGLTVTFARPRPLSNMERTA